MEQMLLPILMFAGLGALMYFSMKQAEACRPPPPSRCRVAGPRRQGDDHLRPARHGDRRRRRHHRARDRARPAHHLGARRRPARSSSRVRSESTSRVGDDRRSTTPTTIDVDRRRSRSTADRLRRVDGPQVQGPQLGFADRPGPADGAGASSCGRRVTIALIACGRTAAAPIRSEIAGAPSRVARRRWARRGDTSWAVPALATDPDLHRHHRRAVRAGVLHPRVEHAEARHRPAGRHPDHPDRPHPGRFRPVPRRRCSRPGRSWRAGSTAPASPAPRCRSTAPSNLVITVPGNEDLNNLTRSAQLNIRPVLTDAERATRRSAIPPTTSRRRPPSTGPRRPTAAHRRRDRRGTDRRRPPSRRSATPTPATAPGDAGDGRAGRRPPPRRRRRRRAGLRGRRRQRRAPPPSARTTGRRHGARDRRRPRTPPARPPAAATPGRRPRRSPATAPADRGHRRPAPTAGAAPGLARRQRPGQPDPAARHRPGRLDRLGDGRDHRAADAELRRPGAVPRPGRPEQAADRLRRGRHRDLPARQDADRRHPDRHRDLRAELARAPAGWST